MATFITVDHEESQLLERNRRQVDANRLEALEAQEREKLSRQIKAAVDSQDEIVAGRLRRRRREELAATVISKPERRACLVEVSFGDVFGPAPIEPVPAGYYVLGDNPSTMLWNNIVNYPYIAQIGSSAVNSAKKEEYNQIGNLHFIGTSTFYEEVQTPPFDCLPSGYFDCEMPVLIRFKNYFLLDLGKHKNRFSTGSTEYEKFSAIDLSVQELSYTYRDPGGFTYYNYNYHLPLGRFRLILRDGMARYVVADSDSIILVSFDNTNSMEWWPNRGPLNINFPLTINLYPTKDAKAIDDAINGDGFEPIIQVATQKNWKQTAVKNYNWYAATTNPPPASFPKTIFATVKANINKFEFLIT